jgi:peptidase E
VGLLALVGGDEFNSGNEEQDRMLAAAAGSGTAFVVPTAAARQKPEQSVAHAKKWFRQFGRDLVELPVLKRSDAMSAALGLEHTKLTYHFQGRDYRLTDVYGNVVNQLLA